MQFGIIRSHTQMARVYDENGEEIACILSNNKHDRETQARLLSQIVEALKIGMVAMDNQSLPSD